jgi:hypothetical protein
MRSLVGIVAFVMFTSIALVQPLVAQEQQLAVDRSCASWLQGLEKSKTDDFFGALRTGYALGVMSTVSHERFAFLRRSETSLKNVGELITALDSICAGTPQKRLIDVALYTLGFR